MTAFKNVRFIYIQCRMFGVQPFKQIFVILTIFFGDALRNPLPFELLKCWRDMIIIYGMNT